MKTTLAYDSNRAVYRCDLGRPSKRFYLGQDPVNARQRKRALSQMWARFCASGGEAWDAELLAAAKQIAKGETVQILHIEGESDEQFRARERRIMEIAGPVATVESVAPEDLTDAVESVLLERIAQLEALVRDHIGAGAVVGADVTVHAAIDAWHEYRKTTELSPGTGETTEHVRAEGNNVRLVKRLIDDIPLTRLSYTQIHAWCKAIANRPISIKTGRPIKPKTASNCLKVVRMFIRWASRNYGWTRPEEWHEATRVTSKRTVEERREAALKIDDHYTIDQIGTLWAFALPSERILIALALNFGFAQAEITAMNKTDLAGDELRSFRGKSSVFGVWSIWPETRELVAAEMDRIPRRRQHIANKWNQLLDRVQRDVPEFRRLSFKWLRKTGSSLIRKIAGGEVASTYLSHGEATDDALLEVYAAKDWNKLANALATLRDQLLPHLQRDAMTMRSYIPQSKIGQIRDGWAAGLKAEEIMRRAQVSRATAYRYRPVTAPLDAA